MEKVLSLSNKTPSNNQILGWNFELSVVTIFLVWLWKSNLHNYFNLHVCPSIWHQRHVPLLSFQFLQWYHIRSLVKVAWYVLRVKNMHSWSPSHPWGPLDEMKLSYIHYNIRGVVIKLHTLKIASVIHHLPSVGPKQLCPSAHVGCTREGGTF